MSGRDIFCDRELEKVGKMDNNPLAEVYRKFRIRYYRDVFHRINSRELTLSATEVYCVEIIAALGRPTINEFASFIDISSPNATYKVNTLIRKGYVEKVQSDSDKREYNLMVTDKYYKYYNISKKYMDIIEDRLENTLTREEFETFNNILVKISDELMPEAMTPD